MREAVLPEVKQRGVENQYWKKLLLNLTILATTTDSEKSDQLCSRATSVCDCELVGTERSGGRSEGDSLESNLLAADLQSPSFSITFRDISYNIYSRLKAPYHNPKGNLSRVFVISSSHKNISSQRFNRIQYITIKHNKSKRFHGSAHYTNLYRQWVRTKPVE